MFRKIYLILQLKWGSHRKNILNFLRQVSCYSSQKAEAIWASHCFKARKKLENFLVQKLTRAVQIPWLKEKCKLGSLKGKRPLGQQKSALLQVSAVAQGRTKPHIWETMHSNGDTHKKQPLQKLTWWSNSWTTSGAINLISIPIHTPAISTASMALSG